MFVELIVLSPNYAQETTSESRRLENVERDIARGEKDRDRLFQAQSQATRELEAARLELIAVARDIQDQEYSLLVLENRLADMETTEARLNTLLAGRDRQMERVLLALERLALRPNDAVMLSPLRPADAVRTGILLRAAVPSLRNSSAELQAKLAELYAVRAQMTGQREQIALGAARLVTRRGDLTRIERDRAQRQAALATATSDATLRLDRLAREAQDLRELLDTLAAAKKRRDDEERAKRAAEPAIASPPAPEPGPPAPDFSPLVAELKPISEARGTLPFPVVGSVTQLYGEAEDAAGVRSKGITIKTRAAAQVIAPFDGVVAFAGPFRAYGLLLIIEHSEGYHTLLAGLGRVDRTVGQRVLAGEPVGAMDGDGEPSLYVELRRDGQPMNPLPWLANRTGKSSG